MKPSKRNFQDWERPSGGSGDPDAGRRPDPVGIPCSLYARPLLPLLLSFITGILLGDRFSGYTPLAVLPVLAGFLLTAHAVLRSVRIRFWPLILFLCLGYLAIQPWGSPRLPENHISRFADGGVRRITGRVATVPEVSNGRIKFFLNAETLSDEGGDGGSADERSDGGLPVVGTIRVTGPAEGPELIVGDRIGLEGRLRRPRNFHNPGGFDYERFMALKGVRAMVYARKGTLHRLSSDFSGEGKAGHAVTGGRKAVAAFFDRLSEGEGADLLKALVVGDRSAIDPATREAFTRAGAAHLLAISGLHVGIVAAAAFGLFAWLLSRSRILLWRAWTRKGAALLTFLPVAGYGLLAGMSPSTQRAVIMVSLFLLALLVERERDGINILAAAALAILIYHPPALFSVSFQLSFSAVTAILYGLSRIERPGDRPDPDLRHRLFLFIRVSLLAILGTLPLVMYYFNQISFIGVATNLIFIPLIGFIIVPAGLITAALLPLSDLMAAGTGHVAIFLMEAALCLVRFFADLPIAAAKTVTPSIVEILLYYLLGVALLNGIWGQGKRRRMAAVACGVILLAGVVDGAYWHHRRFGKETLRVTVLDVGQGSAALVQLPDGRCLLADGGGFYDNDIFDVGRYLVAPFLWRNKIRTVETLVLSHPNADHLNGLLYIADHFHVDQLWTSGETAETAGFDCLMETARREAIRVPAYPDLRRSVDPAEPMVEILYPPIGFLERRLREDWRKDENNNSLVLKITYGDISFLFPGDIGKPAETELIKTAGARLRSTVLIAPHHGSRTSSSRVFLEAVDPEVIVISAGWKNRFHFPHPSVIKRYREIGARIYRTDLHGAIRMVTDGQGLLVEPTLQP
jgi:competence protein ComEC